MRRDDVDFLDTYAKERGLQSRSAALQSAVRLLRIADLAAAYEAAWDEMVDPGDAEAWESTTSDGLDRSSVAPRLG